MIMPCPLVDRTKLSHRIRYFFIWSFVAAHVTCSNSEWGYWGFLWTKGTPKYISRNRAALVNISGEQGNKPNFGGLESGNLENSLAIRIRYCPSAIAVFRCFINIQKDADERKLTQADRTNIAIYAPNLRNFATWTRFESTHEATQERPQPSQGTERRRDVEQIMTKPNSTFLDNPQHSWRRQPGCLVNLTDFANMVKAFIGSNYLYVAYAFKQSGLALGIIGFLVIAALTDHCCHLIATVKHHAIENLVQAQFSGNKSGKPRKYYTVNNRNGTPALDSGVDDEDSDIKDTAPLMGDRDDDIHSKDSEDDNDSESDSIEFREHMFKHMTYGDIGKVSFGKAGVGIVNFCIALTQFGFCVAYCIFIGNTIHSLFPTKLCYTVNGTSFCEKFDQEENLHVKRSVNDSDMLSSDISSPTLSNFSQQVPQNISILSDLQTTLASIITKLEPNSTTTERTLAPIITTLEPNSTTTSPDITTQPNVTAAEFIREITSHAPDLKILVAAPVPIFIIFALIRSVRYLGIISMIANASILVGLVALFGFLLSDFKIHDVIVWFNWSSFPVFFGMVTGAFEGIGLVIPIESSMEGNRWLFPWFLHGAIFILAAILGSFGILGYLKYGVGVKQMLNGNIPSGNPLSIAVNIGICIGILLTFPLQIFPVIEILEKYLFTEGQICGPKKEEISSETTQLTEDDTAPLMGDVAVHIPASVPTWKRNILRLFVVLVAGSLAVLLKDNFAYVGAFVGSVGSSLLAYILPCLFHMKICWHKLNPFIKTKDILIVVFGLIASLVSVVSVIQEMGKNTKV